MRKYLNKYWFSDCLKYKSYILYCPGYNLPEGEYTSSNILWDITQASDVFRYTFLVITPPLVTYFQDPFTEIIQLKKRSEHSLSRLQNSFHADIVLNEVS